jgi:hypothetical protein
MPQNDLVQRNSGDKIVDSIKTNPFRSKKHAHDEKKELLGK